jgi:hypothetical protein
VVREFDVLCGAGFVSIDFSGGSASDLIISGIEVMAADG